MVLEAIRGAVKGLLDSAVGDYVFPTAVIVVGATLADPVTNNPLDVPLDIVKGVLGKIF